MYAGPRQRTTLTVTTATFVTVTVRGCYGARMLAIKLFGGTTGGAITLGASNGDEGAAITASMVGLAGKEITGVVVNSRTEANAWHCYFVNAPSGITTIEPFPFPKVFVTAQVATADTGNVTFDIWPMFATAEDRDGSEFTTLRIA